MSNRPAINKRQLAVRVSIDLLQKIKRLAALNGRSESVELTCILEEGTRNVTLTSNDYELIKREVQKNEKKRKRQNGEK